MQVKRDFRKLWVQRINAGAREHDVKYGELMHALGEENIALNRKMLAELAAREPKSFKALCDNAKQQGFAASGL